MRITELLEHLPHITATGPLDAQSLRGVVQQRDAELRTQRAERKKAELLKQRQREEEWRRRHALTRKVTLKQPSKRKRVKRSARFQRESLALSQ